MIARNSLEPLLDAVNFAFDDSKLPVVQCLRHQHRQTLKVGDHMSKLCMNLAQLVAFGHQSARHFAHAIIGMRTQAALKIGLAEIIDFVHALFFILAAYAFLLILQHVDRLAHRVNSPNLLFTLLMLAHGNLLLLSVQRLIEWL